LAWAAAIQSFVPGRDYIGRETVVVVEELVDWEGDCIEDLVLLTRRNLDLRVLLGFVVFRLHRPLVSSLLDDLLDDFPLKRSLYLLSGISCKAKVTVSAALSSVWDLK
jgi:hypothetical protein